MAYSCGFLLLTAALVAGRDRNPLPQSTVLALTAGEELIASPAHPRSLIFRVHPPASGGPLLCRPVAGIACCRGDDAWYVITNRYREGDFDSATFRTPNNRPLSDRQLGSWGPSIDTLIPGASIGKAGARAHIPQDAYIIGSPEAVRCFATWTGGALEPYAQASTEAHPPASMSRSAQPPRAPARARARARPEAAPRGRARRPRLLQAPWRSRRACRPMPPTRPWPRSRRPFCRAQALPAGQPGQDVRPLERRGHLAADVRRRGGPSDRRERRHVGAGLRAAHRF